MGQKIKRTEFSIEIRHWKEAKVLSESAADLILNSVLIIVNENCCLSMAGKGFKPQVYSNMLHTKTGEDIIIPYPTHWIV